MTINNDLRLIHVNQPIEIVEKILKSRKREIILMDGVMWTIFLPFTLIGKAIEFFATLGTPDIEADDKKRLKKFKEKLKFSKYSSYDIKKMNAEERLTKITQQTQLACDMAFLFSVSFYSWGYQRNYMDLHTKIHEQLIKENLGKIPVRSPFTPSALPPSPQDHDAPPSYAVAVGMPSAVILPSPSYHENQVMG